MYLDSRQVHWVSDTFIVVGHTICHWVNWSTKGNAVFVSFNLLDYVRAFCEVRLIHLSQLFLHTGITV